MEKKAIAKGSFAGWYLVVLLLLGVGYLCVTPAFEGFDEVAHFSSLRQLADGRGVPLYERSFIDKSAVEYKGPVAYGTMQAVRTSFEDGVKYFEFFEQPEILAPYISRYRGASPLPKFEPTTKINWEAQHPPLYYLLLAPLERATNSLNFIAQFWVMRLASYLLALIGVFFCFWRCRIDPTAGGWPSYAAGFCVYVLVLPMFFPEFARLGNDSLCLLLTGAIALVFAEWMKRPESQALPIGLGLLFGLGLLTKAIMLPILAAMILFLVVHMHRERLTTILLRVSRLALPAILIGGGWYVYKAKVYGDISGSEEAITLARHGGMLANLKLHFTAFAFLRGLVSPWVSWSWAGSQSLVHVPMLVQLPVEVTLVWLLFEYARKLNWRRPGGMEWLPVYLVVVFAAGLTYHVFVGIALASQGNTPGWYTQVLMPWVAPALGIGVMSIWRRPLARRLLCALLVYAAYFHINAMWSEITLYTGYSVKGEGKNFVYQTAFHGLTHVGEILNRLAVLAWPKLGLMCFACGGVLLAWLMLGLRRDLDAAS